MFSKTLPIKSAVKIPRCSITTNVVGGLGNQMFLIANLLATTMRHNERAKNMQLECWLERPALSQSCEEPRPTYWNTVFKSLQGAIPNTNPLAEEKRREGRQMNEEIEELIIPETRPVSKVLIDDKAVGGKNYTLLGFFQSAAYFDDCKDSVVTLLCPPEYTAATGRMVRALNTSGHHSVGLHVRRGDYLRMRDVFEILDHEYYDNALRTLYGSMLGNPTIPIKVFIFSEDKAFAQTLGTFLQLKYNNVEVVLISQELLRSSTILNNVSRGGSGGNSEEEETRMMGQDVAEMFMMMHLNDVVIANSSFSWWGGYLNGFGARGRIVAPGKWFVKDPFPHSSHLYCNDWLIV